MHLATITLLLLREVAMYQNYFGMTEAPFSIAPNPRYLYMSLRHQEALATLLYGLSCDGGFVLLTGEVGAGKTTICRYLLSFAACAARNLAAWRKVICKREHFVYLCGGFHTAATLADKPCVGGLAENIFQRIFSQQWFGHSFFGVQNVFRFCFCRPLKTLMRN